MKFRTKATHVDARQWLGARGFAEQIMEWLSAESTASVTYLPQVPKDRWHPFAPEQLVIVQDDRSITAGPGEWVAIDDRGRVTVWTQKNFDEVFEPASFCLARIPHDGYLCYCVLPWQHDHEGLDHVCNHDFAWTAPAEVA